MHLGAPSQPQSRIQINLPFLPSANGPISTLGSFSLWYHYHPGFQPEPRVIPPPCSCCSLHYNLSALKSFKSPVYPFFPSPSASPGLNHFSSMGTSQCPFCPHFFLPLNHFAITSRLIFQYTTWIVSLLCFKISRLPHCLSNIAKGWPVI